MTHLTMGHGVSECFGTRLAPIALTCGLRISGEPTSENLTLQETTNQDAPDMRPDGADMSCPGSRVVAAGIHGGDQNEKKSGQVETAAEHHELDR
jgi:hypothetical protein